MRQLQHGPASAEGECEWPWTSPGSTRDCGHGTRVYQLVLDPVYIVAAQSIVCIVCLYYISDGSRTHLTNPFESLSAVAMPPAGDALEGDDAKVDIFSRRDIFSGAMDPPCSAKLIYGCEEQPS